MKLLSNKNVGQKVIIAFACVVLFNFCVSPTVVYAEDKILDSTLAGYIFNFLEAIGDVAITVVQYGLTGEWNYAVDEEGSGKIIENGGAKNDYWKTGALGGSKVYYPVIQISPELIFSNQVEILDVDFIGGTDGKTYALDAGDSSAISELRNIIASWYVTLRTVAIVGLLSVLIYIGIRIIISSTLTDRAKYKQRLIDWVVAFCLLFFMHYIMAAVTTVVEQVNGLLSNEDAQLISIPSEYGEIEYVGAGGESVGSGSSASFFQTGDTRESTIQNVKSTAEGLGYTYVGESSSWEIVSSQSVAMGITYTSRYDIYYEETTIILWEDATTITDGYSSATTYSWTVETSGSSDTSIRSSSLRGTVSNDPSKVLYYINYVRLFLNNSKNYGSEALGWVIIYIVLIVFVGMFAIRYIKRVIYIAFLTLMAPLVALTYPLDKIKDRKSSSL